MFFEETKQFTHIHAHREQQRTHREKMEENDKYFNLLPELALQWENFPRQWI